MFGKIFPVFTLPLLLLLNSSSGNSSPQAAQTAPEGFNPGPDIIAGNMFDLYEDGAAGTQRGLAVGITSCNAGNQFVNFSAMPNTNHPAVAQNLYRISGGPQNTDRFEQIGQAWVKHTYGAKQADSCSFGCQPGGDFTHLGVGCSDTYFAHQSAAQGDLGSRAWINPFTGVFQSNARDHTGHAHTDTSHKLLVETADLTPAMNPGAAYYAQLLYITPDEYAWCQTNPGQCNMYNNSSYRRYNVSGSPIFVFLATGETVRMAPAINAWVGATIQAIEPAPGMDGHAFIAYKVTAPSTGVWHYEYAIYNENLDRAIQSFSVPLGGGATVSNLGFHAPLNHPGFPNDGTLGDAGFSNAPWSSNQTASEVSWSTETFAQNQNANAIRWGTLYNFRFDSDRPPQVVNATIGFFKTGTPITVGIEGPSTDGSATPTPVPTLTPTPTPTPPPTPTPTPTPPPTPTPTPTPTPPGTPTPFPTPILPPAGNGQIAFVSQRMSNSDDIWVMNPDGSNQTNLTNSLTPDDIDPDWSPDGTKIAFSSTIDGPLPPHGTFGDIYVMDADGSNRIRLTNDPAGDVSPFWSPDGTKIGFTRAIDNDFEVWVMDADGSNQINLTNHPARDGIVGACWSPDGGKIAFTTDRDNGDGEIYVMDANGSNPINLTNRPGGDGNPDWSPDGTKIVFGNFTQGPQDSDIYVMDANGANQVRLTHPSPDHDDWPAWSPDGTKIAFTRLLLGGTGNREIFVMDANGSNQINLTNNAAPEDRKPDWQRIALPAAQALNLSTRMRVQTGDNVGIAGFIVTGNAAKRVLVRAIGPSLIIDFNRLEDPVLELHDGCDAEICIPELIFPTIINDNWRDTQEAEILATGIPPTNDFESAIVVTLIPGAYTAVIRGRNNTSGRGLVEVYDLNPGVPAKLANVSTRAFVSTGDDIVIAGFILGGNAGQDSIVVRGIGPSLANFGLPNTLANPTLELRDNNGALLISNNDWQDDPAQAAALTAAGLAPAHPLESGLAATLAPGLYTALLSGINNGTGVGLVEVYDLGAP